MLLQIVSGVGTGPTELSAFDDALLNAGLGNYNLLCLSSVIPPGGNVIRCDKDSIQLTGRWGDRMYVVMAHQETSTPNEEAWAGIGWVQNPDTAQGLFVEHEGHSQDSVRSDITDSLGKLVEGRKPIEFGPVDMEVTGITCHEHPVSALVIAVYETSSWPAADLSAPVIGR